MTPPASVVDDPPAPAGRRHRRPPPRRTPFRPLPRPSSARSPASIAIANQKGGVGKTTTAVNLGACLAELGYRVLVVDLDPQGNATTGLGINIRDLAGLDVRRHPERPARSRTASSRRRSATCSCAPASLDLAGAEIELVPAFSRELRLRRALDAVRDDYDFVLIDCPPSLGLLTVNGLAAADEVIVPIQCEYYALEGLGQLLRNVAARPAQPEPPARAAAPSCSSCTTPAPSWPTRWCTRCATTSATRCADSIVPRTVRLSRGAVVRAADHRVRPDLPGGDRLPELAKEVSGGAPQRAG